MSAQPKAARAAVADAQLVLRERDKDIAILVLNRPQARISLSEEMLAALSSAFAAVAADKTIRAVVLAANGLTFCAGHDLKEITAHRADSDGGLVYTRRLMQDCSTLMQAIIALPQPVIAAVEGVATAAGCQLVATCDLAVASASAKFSTPGVQIGLFCSTPMVALTRNVGRKAAMEMLLTGEMIRAEQALGIGLINRVAGAGKARDEAIRLARKITAKSAAIVKLGKQAFYRQFDMNLADAYAYTSEVMVQNMMAPDAEEGIGAFVDKRDPRWHDR
jgi:enoyl-CoA hydratase/carnithine racemase